MECLWNFVQGNIWKAPVWDSLLSVRETNLDRQIDQVSQLLLFKELGSADRISVRKAVVKVFGENPNFANQYNDITGLIARLIFQLPVWSLR